MTTLHRLGLGTVFVIAAVSLWARGQSAALSDDEEAFAGFWRQETPMYKENGQTLPIDVELRRDGTARMSVAGRELPGRSWRVVDGRFQFYKARGNRNVIDAEYEVVVETNDRVRLVSPSTKSTAIIWRRR